uniref:Ig-like domain-containing protein n=1 Tax=Neogobius melanostomus TaxID=47308 RepID=A0A8C6ST76_9GOBI
MFKEQLNTKSSFFLLINCLNGCLIVLSTGQSLWSPRAVVASVGDDVVLPCLFRPPRDVSGQTLEWSRPDLDPKFAFVFVWRSSLELTVLRNPAFAGRATLFTDELKHGNISLKLTSVGVSDDGTYRCFVPELGIDSTVRLHVGIGRRLFVLHTQEFVLNM